ncbi:MAG: OmpH family outer membrane protein [Bacteroidetes bacterium]|nr:MAG: OmpH family outer membrane protein [Bacteroidota bacterium]TNE99953.1 MAG: OmpH family outer membrane protein [Bacteroidota bacterium]
MKKLLLALIVVVSAGAAMAQMKIGHVNSQQLLDTMQSRKIAMQKLADFEKEGVAELRAMEEDLNKAIANYQAKMKDLSPVMQQIEEEKLMKKQQALEDRQQSLQYEMQAYSNELNQPILSRVQEAVKRVAELKKLNYVIDESVTLYFAGGIDITADVAAELVKLEAEANAGN